MSTRTICRFYLIEIKVNLPKVHSLLGVHNLKTAMLSI